MKMLCVSAAFILLSSVFPLPARATNNGDQPEYPASNSLVPVAGVAQTDNAGMPKLDVEFQTAHAEIQSSYSMNLQAFGKYLVDHPGSRAEIDGYADHTGHGPANAALAQKRADAVKDYLVTHCAVASSCIKANGYGEVSGKTRNSTEAGQQTNRSAIAIIIASKS